MSKLLEEQFEIMRKKFEKRIAYFEEKKMYVSEKLFEKTIDTIRDTNEALDELTQLEHYYYLDKNKYKIVIKPKEWK